MLGVGFGVDMVWVCYNSKVNVPFSKLRVKLNKTFDVAEKNAIDTILIF